jgi:predicted nuclease of restriction endonuclease-like (RecB) superfamily
MQLDYINFVQEVKQQILRSRYQAARLANREQLLLYLTIGEKLSAKIASEKWGAKVIAQISDDLQKELVGLRGFSHRNLLKMKQFSDEYSILLISPLPTAKLQNSDNQIFNFTTEPIPQFEGLRSEVFFGIGFTHHILLLSSCKGWTERRFYMEQAVQNQWNVETLDWQIKAKYYQKQGKITNNFAQTLPQNLKNNALLAFKDEYLLDFINVEDGENERIIEQGIVQNIKQFIMTMGKGFAFIGNQHRLLVEDEEYFVDLMFYNRYLKCLVAFELKKGKFKPEYAGKLNFYLNVLNQNEKLPDENPAIGVILCSEKKDSIVKFAFEQINNPMGVAVYQLSKDLPEHLKNILPDARALQKLLRNEDNEPI